MPVSLISWEALEQNAESKELGFEQFNFQLAFILFHKYGVFDYDYNTPGSEFYLTLECDCPDLHAKKGDVIGWQAKFWLSRSDPNNTSLGKSHREELIDGFNKSLEYKPKLVTWVVCTPGQPINTKPHCSKDKLVEAIHGISEKTKVIFWNKPIYEAFRNENFEKLTPVYSHYFGAAFIGRERCFRRTERTLETLRGKFDTDCHVCGPEEKEIIHNLNIPSAIRGIRHRINQLEHFIRWAESNSSSRNPEQSKIEEFKKLAQFLLNKSPSLKTLDDAGEIFSVLRKTWNHYAQLSDGDAVLNGFNFYNLDDFGDTISALYGLLRPAIHVWGEAGSGKTCLSASIANYCLSNNIPTLLLTGRELSGPASIPAQIIEKLDLPSTWTLRETLGALNTLGFLVESRIPIIIDGLNETVPSCYIWRDALNDLVDQISDYPNLLLITTFRPSYSNVLFNTSNPIEIKHSVERKGFSDEEINSAISKYFKKYEISVMVRPANLSLFRHPLLLKLFCLVNKGTHINNITHESVFLAIEKYQNNLILEAATTNGEIDRILHARIVHGVNRLAQTLWERNQRSIAYSDLPEILDGEIPVGTDWRSTVTCKLLDEGLFLRDISAGEEIVEFTYDLVAGMTLTNAVFFRKGRNSRELIQTQDALQKLNGSEGNESHPLSEDIYKALVYLWPKHNDCELLIEASCSQKSAIYTFAMLDLVCSTEEGIRRITAFSKEHSDDSHIMDYLSRGMIESAINHGCFAPAKLLFELLANGDLSSTDMRISEAIRIKQASLLPWVHSLQEQGRLASIDTYDNLMAFLALLLSSPILWLRDNIVRVLTSLVESEFENFRSVTEKVVGLQDATVIESFLCVLCGNVLTSQADVAIEKAHWVKDRIVPYLRTTHVLILDYCDTIFAYAEHLSRDPDFGSWTDSIAPQAWDTDAEVEKDCSEEDANWGYGPIGYEFAKGALNQIASPYREGSLSKKEATSLMLNRIKTLGYDINVLKELDIAIRKEHEKQEYRRAFYEGSYQDKMVKWAFFELWGKLRLEKKLSALNNGFRTPYCRVDPTFPQKPPKQQFILDCYIATQDEDIHEWATRPMRHPVFDENRRVLDSDNQKWVLIDARLTQSGQKDSKLTLSGHLFTCQPADQEIVVNKYQSHGLDVFEADLNHTLAGEIPWRFIDNEEDNWRDDPPVESLIEYYNWCSSDEHTDHPIPTSHTPILKQSLAKQLNLTFSVNEMAYYDQSGIPATKLIWDNTSRFLFIRADLLQSFLRKNGVGLIWCERSFKSYNAKKGIMGYKLPAESDIYFALAPTY